jgi:putative tricarboxylic transport membrane protein
MGDKPVRGSETMSDTPSHGPVKYIMPKWIRGPQDFVGGLAMVAIAVFALWASSDLQGMRGFSDGEHITTYAWRGPLFVSVAILSFAVTIRPMGLIFAAFTSFLISALGTPETQWKQTIIVGICLTAFCSLLFPYALGLPLQMLPKFMIR